MNQDSTQFTPQGTDGLQTPVPMAPEPMMSKKRSKLATWTLIVNVVNYGLPLLAAGIYFAGIASGAIDLYDMGVGILLALVIMAFMGFMSLVSVATLVLDIVYLVKGKPQGKARVWVIISLTVYGLLSLVGLALSIYLMLQQQPY
jgi:hypothetical protein